MYVNTHTHTHTHTHALNDEFFVETHDFKVHRELT